MVGPLGPPNLHPPFAPDEYAARLASVQRSMAERKVDLLIITEPENIYYMTGYQTVGSPEVQALMIDATDKSYFVTRQLEVSNASRSNLRTDQLEVYVDYESGISKLCNVIMRESPSIKTAGLEMTSRRLTAAQRQILESRLSCNFVDCSSLIPKHRLIKSPAEIAIMKRAAEICAAGVQAGLSSTVHMTESQIAGNIYHAMCEKGGEYPAYPPFVCAGRNGCIGHYTGSGHHALRDGDLLFLEIGGCFERYHAALMRSCYVGTALPQALAEAEAAVLKAMDTAKNLMRPGAVARDVDRAARRELEKVQGTMSLRSGYSIGIGFYPDWGEAEHFRMDPGSEQVFEEKMVLHLIPWLQLPDYGGVGLSDTVLITPHGAVSLFDRLVRPQIALIPPSLRQPFGPEESQRVRRVLKLEPTPLEKLHLEGLGSLFVKDESKRLGLQAFKVVGGAYAMLRFMCKRLALPMVEEHQDVSDVQRQYAERFGITTFVTATDGNHGRGVSWAAKTFGQKAVVYMPKGSALQRLQHVKDLGAEAEITDLNYDDTVEMAFAEGRKKGWVVLQDTTAPGYTEIPEWIMQGYTAMVQESLEAMEDFPSHVLLQMGVGSMAAAVVGHFSALRVSNGYRMPRFLVLEPKNAACGLESMRNDGKLTEVTGELDTMIAGLACGVPSSIAWPILREHVSAFVSVEDEIAGNGMRLLHRHGIEAGECGGAAAGLLEHIMSSNCQTATALREALALGADSQVLIINTEGATDPENYRLQLTLPHVKPRDGMLTFELGIVVHTVEPSTIKVAGHKLQAKLAFANDRTVKPLLLELSFFLSDGKSGIVRTYLTEEEPLHPRFRLTAGDVVRKEEEMQVDVVSMKDIGGATEVASSGDCKVRLKHSPFELHFIVKDEVVQKLNSQHLLNFERYRPRGSQPHAGLVDATDVDSNDLFEESFGGHTDSKPRGPAGVGIDVSFEDAIDVFGLAEHATGLGLAENKLSPYRFFNLDVFEYALDVPMALYGAIPLVTAIHQPKSGGAFASGFFFPNPSEGFVHVEKQGHATRSWWLFESGVMDMFFLAGPAPQDVLQRYHMVTGFPRLPPFTTLGKHQCRWNYVDVDDSINVNRKFDQYDIPYDVLWLDIEHTDSKKYFTWHPTHFSQAGKLLDTLEASGRKLVTIIDPHIKKDTGYDVYKKMQSHDLFTKTKDKQLYDGWCWPGTSSYPDFCNPEARKLWTSFFRMDYYPHNRPDLYTWNDMNEPSVFNGPEVTMPRDNLHKCSENDYKVEHRDIHNVYGFYHHMATVEGQLARAPNVRPFVLTRSFFAGSHRHGAIWTGDNMAKWEHLAISVPMLVSLCLCGASFVGADVPGFFYDPEPELFRRWHQLGIWYPFYRGHAHLETKRREPWMLGDAIMQNVREQVSVRYQMLPTWYTLFAQWAHAGVPIMQPLWYQELGDLEAFKHQNTHYLLGSDILVRAISKAGEKSVDLYLPSGTWFDFWDLQAAPLAGGKHHRKTSPEHVPVFVRSGAILVKKMRRRRSSMLTAADPYTLVIYGNPSQGFVYLDDGQSHEFKQGKFIYDKLPFNGEELTSQPNQRLHAVGPANGGLGSKQSTLIERLVFVGLKSAPRRAVGGGKEFEVTTTSMSNGAFVANVKKPMCNLGTSWKLQLLF
ncbi:3-alpha-glucosidase (Glucosidase II subunit alpha) (Protein PRIORITY IN SWEET LIFE 5) (Protein RADIAL SWELLING 3) [Durusdinium trenchii]|uniref:Glucosidase II subunit alpha n=1 Tax=Durusdinium trenchii TaxID=1381693 RepID=A0ABP0K4C7_9DINO